LWECILENDPRTYASPIPIRVFLVRLVDGG
jgi:hypothetical protein